MTKPTNQTQNHYTILSLTHLTTTKTIPKPTLKQAYHRALLHNHPDKSTTSATTIYTIDAITTAYKTLSNPATRAEYDRSLLLQRNQLYRSSTGNGNGDGHPSSFDAETGTDNDNDNDNEEWERFRTGLETVDLEDLEFHEAREGYRHGHDTGIGAGAGTMEEDGGGMWSRGCRCGDDRGFLVTEADLEGAVELDEGGGGGEVVVGCRGCSLWLRVLFAVADDEDELEAGP